MAGGEIKEYTEMLAESREIAMQRMSGKAEEIGIDRVAGVIAQQDHQDPLEQVKETHD